jgi:hypothetical protein
VLEQQFRDLGLAIADRIAKWIALARFFRDNRTIRVPPQVKEEFDYIGPIAY